MSKSIYAKSYQKGASNMERQNVVEIIKAIKPYVRMDKDALISALLAKPITELPDDLASQDENVLLALAWRDIESDTAGILPDWQKVTITQITLKKSGSGNETYYCDMVDEDGNAIGQPLYFGTQNGYKAIALGIYPQLAEMPLKSVATDVSITAYVTHDGKFYELQRLEPNGKFNFGVETEAERKNRVITERIDPLYANGDVVYLDFETTALNGEICQVGIVGLHEEYTTYIKPLDPARLMEKGKNGKCASDFNNITPDMLDDAPTFPDVYEEIKSRLEGKTVVMYNAEFDKKRLLADIKRHGSGIFNYDDICLMNVYAEYNGEVNSRGYKSQKLENAYEAVTGVKHADSHDALADAKAMQEIVMRLYHSNKRTDLQTIKTDKVQENLDATA